MQGVNNMEQGFADYGALKMNNFENRIRADKKAYGTTVGPGLIIGCIVVPWLIFVITYYTMSFFIRYWAPYVAFFVAGITLLACLGFGGMAAGAAMGKGGDPLWLGLLCLLSLVGWTWAITAGGENYASMMFPYYNLNQLNTYQSVDPSTAQGNQYMDFGVIGFVEKSRIDRVFSMAFKNDDTYCVAPVKLNGTTPKNYDFWAVGINCCSSHLYDFRCGQWNNPAARSGMRIVDESQRAFYQLAVKQSEAAYNIVANHPVFFEWVTDGRDQIEGYQETGFHNFLTGAFYFFLLEVVAVFLLACAFAKA